VLERLGTANLVKNMEDQSAVENIQIEQSYFAALLNNIPHIAWLKDQQCRFIAVNQSFADAFGYEASELTGKDDFYIAASELAQGYREDDLLVMASGKRQIVEEIIINAEGNPRWLETIKTPIRDSNGQITGTVGIAWDITDRKRSEIALRESERRYQKLSDNIPGVIYQFRVTPEGRIDFPYISSGCFELFQLSPAAVMADSNCLLEMIHADDILSFHHVVAESAKQMNFKLWEGRIVLKSGEIKWIKSASRPESQPDGSIVWDAVVLDTTEQQALFHDRNQAQIELHQTNQRLELSNAELLRATRLRDEFLATMSHELRTPLNAILGMSEALQEEVFGTLTDRQLKSLQTIERSGRHLLSLINDILDVSKISAGKLELNITPVSVLQLCHSSLAFVKQQAYEKQLQLDIQLPQVAGKIAVDERRMCQVLINLLNNAVKFTPIGGQIDLQVTRNDDLDIHLSWIEFAITDTGIGIAPSDLDKLFQPFVQVDSSLNRQYEGTGLGLTLVKQIVELHGGSVVLQSELGHGSCVTVRLPHPCPIADLDSHPLLPLDSVADYSRPIDPAMTIVQPALILLAEDNAANSNTFCSYLNAKGYRTILAENGLEVISILEGCTNDLAQSQPDLILMDIQMPEMDGLQAIEWIRQHAPLAKIPIVALTALAMEGDREKCLAAGANEYLTKPVKLKLLADTIQQLLRGQ
jgi:PAS domain S-box-containing protein